VEPEHGLPGVPQRYSSGESDRECEIDRLRVSNPDGVLYYRGLPFVPWGSLEADTKTVLDPDFGKWPIPE
jgi:hypothetical protein